MRRTKLSPFPGLVHVGTEYGGWWVPGGLITPEWLCYSVGAGNDVSFDLGLIHRYGARVRAVDPFYVFREMAEREAGGDQRYSFHEVALAPYDGPVEMFGRQDLERGSVSAVNLYGVDTPHTKPGRSLPSLMAELGDEKVDLLKIDVEGSEYQIVPTLDLSGLGVRVFCVEFHHNEPARQARQLLGALGEQGYETVHRHDPAAFTLVRSDLRPR